MIPAKDISRYQGAWTDTGEPIIMVKISGGDAGLYVDSQAAANYNAVIAAGKAFGGYHFAGGTDPIAEANFYLAAMKPWNRGEVPALDWEVGHTDPVGWCNAFTTHVHDVGGAWPLIYMNLSTLRSYDWSPVLKNCGLWLADWNNDPSGTINTGGHVYVMQQYSDGPNYDHDEWYGTIAAFKAYGWPGAITPPTPTTTTTLPPAPITTTTTTTTIPPTYTTTSTSTTTSSSTTTTTLPQVVVGPTPPIRKNLVMNVLIAILRIVKKIIGVK